MVGSVFRLYDAARQKRPRLTGLRFVGPAIIAEVTSCTGAALSFNPVNQGVAQVPDSEDVNPFTSGADQL